MLIGYTRVSAVEQSTDLELDVLHAANVEQVFVDEGVSGSVSSRPNLTAASHTCVLGTFSSCGGSTDWRGRSSSSARKLVGSV